MNEFIKLCAQTSTAIYSQSQTCNPIKAVWSREFQTLEESNATAPQEPLPQKSNEDRHASSDFYFTSCRWTPDGSSVLTTSSDQVVRLFVAPPDLLSAVDGEQILEESLLPYARLPFPSSTTATAIYPGFKISEYAPAMVLVAIEDHPVKLYNVHSRQCVASYPITNPHRDTFDNSLALEFPRTNSDVFLAGTRGQRGRVDLVSLLRPGSNTETTKPLASAHVPDSLATGYRRAIVSAIAAKPQPDGGDQLIAAVGFYQGGGQRECGMALYDFRVDQRDARCTMVSPATTNDDLTAHPWRRKANGTTSILWNPAGASAGSESLIYQVPRNGSSNVIVRDARMGLREIGHLECAEQHGPQTQQRLGADWVRHRRTGPTATVDHEYQQPPPPPPPPSQPSFDLHVGTTNGSVRIYRNPAHGCFNTDTAGAVVQSLHGSSVCGISWNPQVARDDLEIVATCSGTRTSEDDDTTTAFPETSLRIWAFKYT